MDGFDRLALILVHSGDDNRTRPVRQQLTDDLYALLGRLSRCVDSLGQPLANRSVVIDLRLTDFGEGKACDLAQRVICADLTVLELLDQDP